MPLKPQLEAKGNPAEREILAGVLGYTRYDDRDRLQTEDATAYGWDATGNLTSKSGAEGATYEWDFENRLKKVVLANGTSVVNKYDVDGTRVRTVTTPAGGPAQTVDYLVDTSGALSQVVLESSTAATATGYYVRGEDLISLLRRSGDAPAVVKSCHADGLGSVRALTDSAGAVTDTWQFEAFGTMLNHLGSDPNSYLFTGEPLDSNLRWSYHRARWMDPTKGIFPSLDLEAPNPTSPGTLHRFIYASHNPSNRKDPSGLENFLSANFANVVIQTINLIALGLTAVAVDFDYHRSTGQFRYFTSGEKVLITSVFGSSLQDIDHIRVYKGKAWLLQQRWRAMSPHGSIFYPVGHRDYSSDISRLGLQSRALLIHETTHVWQAQQKQRWLVEGIWDHNYDYEVIPGRKFADYGIEQQATLVEIYYQAREELRAGKDFRRPKVLELQQLIPFVPKDQP